MKKNRYLLSFFAVFLFIWIGILWYYSHLIHYPDWYHPFAANYPECTDVSITQKKFDSRKTLVSLLNIKTHGQTIRAWHLKALQKRTGKGAILIHGGGANHNNLSLYAHFLNRHGWDAFIFDLPNHGCSSNDGTGIHLATHERVGFMDVYNQAEKLFKVKALIGTSMGSTVAALETFEKNLPVDLILENPMLSLERVITDQSIFPVALIIKKVIAGPLLILNSKENLPPITRLKPPGAQKILLLYGTKDHLTPVSQSRELKEAWGKNVQLEIINESSHSRIYENAPGKVESLLENFLVL